MFFSFYHVLSMSVRPFTVRLAALVWYRIACDIKSVCERNNKWENQKEKKKICKWFLLIISYPSKVFWLETPFHAIFLQSIRIDIGRRQIWLMVALNCAKRRNSPQWILWDSAKGVHIQSIFFFPPAIWYRAIERRKSFIANTLKFKAWMSTLSFGPYAIMDFYVIRFESQHNGKIATTSKFIIALSMPMSSTCVRTLLSSNVNRLFIVENAEVVFSNIFGDKALFFPIEKEKLLWNGNNLCSFWTLFME